MLRRHPLQLRPIVGLSLMIIMATCWSFSNIFFHLAETKSKRAIFNVRESFCRLAACGSQSGHLAACGSQSGHLAACDSQSGHLAACGSQSGHLEACDSQSGHLEACDSQSGHLEACDSQSGHLEACDSQSGHLEACGSQSGHLEACDSQSGHLAACGSQSGHLAACGSQPGHLAACGSQSGHLAACDSQSGHLAACGSQSGHLEACGSQPGHLETCGSQSGHLGACGSQSGHLEACGSQSRHLEADTMYRPKDVVKGRSRGNVSDELHMPALFQWIQEQLEAYENFDYAKEMGQTPMPVKSEKDDFLYILMACLIISSHVQKKIKELFMFAKPPELFSTLLDWLKMLWHESCEHTVSKLSADNAYKTSACTPKFTELSCQKNDNYCWVFDSQWMKFEIPSPFCYFGPSFELLASYRPISGNTLPLSVSPVTLSEAGFKYTGKDDLIQCNDCHKIVKIIAVTSKPTDQEYHEKNCVRVLQDKASSENGSYPTSAPSHTTFDEGFVESEDSTTGDALGNSREDTGCTGNNTSFITHTKELQGATASPISHPDSWSVTQHGRQQTVSAFSNAEATPSLLVPAQKTQNNVGEDSVLTEEDVPNRRNPSSFRSTSQDIINSNSGVEDISSLSELSQCPESSVFERPSYPAYVSYDSRLDSFAEWNYGNIHDPVTLTEAGFFYAGYADCVRCFQCGLGLRSWKPGDDVYCEHHKHRPNCSYLQTQLRVKGITDPVNQLVQQPRESNTEPRNHAYTNNGPPTGVHNKLTTDVQEINAQQPWPRESVVGYVNDSTTESRDAAANIVKSSEQNSNVSHQPAATGGNKNNHSDLTRRLLQRENKILQKQLKCKICHVNPIKHLFLPCGDLYACADCSKLLTHCPGCDKKILATVTTYFT